MSKVFKLVFSIIIIGCLVAAYSAATTDPVQNDGVWHHYFIYPMSLLIIYIAKSWVFHSFGAAIMLVTLGVRMLLMPLNVMQFKTQMNMRKVQPQLQKLREKYSSKQGEEQKQYQIEMLQLMRDNQANPMMGCLPLFIQMPVFSAVYYTIRHTQEISSSSFLWLNLGHADPYFILPLLAALTTYIQTRVTQVNLPEQQRAQMKMMQTMSPLMVLAFGFASPAGLVLYWITGNLFMIAQYTILQKVYKGETVSV